MNKEKAIALLDKFPQLSPQVEKEMRNLLKQYLIIEENGKTYCTYCEQSFNIVELPKHRSEVFCPVCAEPVECIRNYHNFCGSIVEDTANAVVIMSSSDDDNLYIRCYTLRVFFKSRELYPDILPIEVQRYVFTDKQCVRYGRGKKSVPHTTKSGYTYWTNEYTDKWAVRTKFSEPIFNNSRGYSIVNSEAIRDTCMRYSVFEEYDGNYPISYLKFYQKHHGAERLIKCGLGSYVNNAMSGGGYGDAINWSENEVHKMLGVTADVCRRIRNGDITLERYNTARECFPEVPLDTLIKYSNVIGHCYGSLDRACNVIKSDKKDLCKYLSKQGVNINDYNDYLRVCKKLKYDFSDRSVAFPKCFKAAHDRVYLIQHELEREQRAQKQREQQIVFQNRMKSRKELEYASGDLFIRQPQSIQEIVDEGRILSHCVGGYTERHANGKLHIMFLRKVSDPDTPYYTVEVSASGKIVQCRGYKNNWESNGGKPKPQKIVEFEKEYQQYLDGIFAKKKKKERRSA